MGSFFGHIDEGIVFILMAVWWLWNIWKNITWTEDNEKQYTSRLSYTTNIKGRVVPLEIIFKIVFPFGAFWAEIIDAKSFINEEGDFSNLSNLQHTTIYMLFTIHGVTDLLGHYRPKQFDGLRYFTIGLGFFWYGVTFYYHSMPNMDKPEMENVIHRLPITLIMVTGVCVGVECLWRNSVYPQIIRSFCVLTLGTWFTYTSFVLFLPFPFPGPHHNPAWDQSDERNVHFMVAAFGIHLNTNMMFILVSAIFLDVIRRRFYACSKISGSDVNIDVKYRLLNTTDDLVTDEV